ncbi:MAG: OmpA family protein [Bacteroidetes bacterium]|nr:OmpA family protein [Bacteroidota bacterium]
MKFILTVITLLTSLGFLQSQNKLNSRLFYSKPSLYNSKSKVDHFDLTAYDVSVSIPEDNRSKFYNEIVYKNIKTHELEEFFKSPTMAEIQNKIKADVKKFRSGKHRASIGQLVLNPSVEVFYPKMQGFIRGKSLAKVRLEMTALQNNKPIIQKKYESLYITNGFDNGFEGDVNMTMEEGQNITVGMALRMTLDQFYLDLKRILMLPKNKMIVCGLVVNSKTDQPISTTISFRSDSTFSVTSLPNGSFEIVLTKKQYRSTIVALNYINFSEVIDLTEPDSRMKEVEFKLKPIEKRTVVNLQNVLFYTGTTDLLETSYAELDDVVSFLNNNPKVKIELRGHTDNQGSANKDLLLSQERVDKIKSYLVSHGIASNRIAGKGLGGTQPIASNTTEEGRKLNRRVEFVILKN